MFPIFVIASLLFILVNILRERENRWALKMLNMNKYNPIYIFATWRQGVIF